MKKTRFEWDSDKDVENQIKHGVPFSLAQFAFGDPNRVIAEDLAHSNSEKRLYCFGLKAASSPFDLLIAVTSFESLVPVTGGRAS